MGCETGFKWVGKDYKIVALLMVASINHKNTRMINFTYKCIHVPMVMESTKSHSEVIGKYEKLINDAALDGWELSNIDSIISSQSPGCFSGLFGGKDVTQTLKILVFRKEVIS